MHVVERMPGKKQKVQGRIKYHPALIEEMANAETSSTPRLLPMIVPPKPWMTMESGGYLTQSSMQPLVRLTDNQYMRGLLKSADTQGQLNTVLHGLDVLGATPWRINKKLLKIVVECWKSGDAWPSIVQKDPFVLEDIATPPNGAGKAEWWKFFDSRAKFKNSEQSRYSQRCDANYKVLIAKAV